MSKKINRKDAAIATANYLQKRWYCKVAAFAGFALLIASIVMAHRPDDWARFDHRHFQVIDAPAGDLLNISVSGETQTVKLLGIQPTDKFWLEHRTAGSEVTLLLESPQTRDSLGHLRAFAFCGDENLSVEAVKQGTARADRREKTSFDGVIHPAEAEAKKKSRGMWQK